ncbi:hypothetical protein H112_01720 [Trichophyton rubrum D6]|uniref:HTH La-type RNA-binding domain-containing protein n=1 Tax=Trichophyton rubrum CBS 288.86 TaxID=1215330 RepID=A0A022WBS4_TRIRU|nr:hypothetical protein H100_01716 [Trichophyton rubrum MR850]EZF45115.1 hypothetical protein H102_01708 [Trichophyton rubrum CBS 100081]EZF55758.1 hypothetical protein H103_01722 [Trichophyton rubrum CBS 288.86]EZF66447.1 hypothetical protein H104_01696 [Trichophyton rubrum CBS 289.86]EZF87659.1 hypothetical protein H110_01720 [Trichophyton rubrum MR1448]EZF98463.1 hypothetical protein H113_01719 [Trichophyton rubrum MR1459]EZG20028.1 hypothetical protein H107_01773 [Trichophyton rubrum CBS 
MFMAASSVSAKKSTPEMPVFSYAQAAKGLASDSNSKQTPTPPSVEETGTTTASTSTTTMVDGDDAGKAVSASPSLGLSASTASTLVKEDDLSTTTPNGTTTATASESEWEKQSQASTAADNKEKSAGSSSSTAPLADDEKPKSEASWENTTNTQKEHKEQQKEQKEQKELKAAPPPAVNIWQQRQEALEAKAKANALKPAATTTATTTASTTTPPTTTTKNTSTQTPSGDVRSEHYKGGSRKKADPATSEKKKATDGSRKSARPARQDAESLPPVNDASSWPTPQTAQGEDLRKAQDQADKPERPEKEKPAGSRAHGKEKWMPVPYVPTAVFNTPLPPAARRGGRSGGPRGGAREGGSRGGAHAGGDRATTTTSTSKPSSAGEREKGDATESAQKSTTAADASLKNGDVAAPAEATKDNRPVQNSINTAATTSSDPTSSSQSPTRPHQSKSYHKSHEDSSSSYKNAHADQHASRQANSDSHAGGHSRYANHDRRFDMGARSGEFFKDYQPRGDRDFSKDREYSREYTRESRSERGGRGGYRGGRGGHSNYNNTNNTTSTTQTSSASASSSYHSAPIPQHPFPSSKTYNNFSDRHRIQPSANGTQQQQQQQQPHSSTTTNNRLNMRSPSMPNPGIFPAPYPIQTDMNILYPYPHALPAGPMTAMSYQPYMEHYSLMGTISMQLEYYFSVDNLCKDLFLRRHMDSQGYVLLSVIASFKRIKSLTEDMELLRFVCRQLRNVEYRPGEDGVDRLRKREEWAQWVLSMDERDPSARNEGPSSATAQEYIPQHQQAHMNGHAHAHAHAHVHGKGTYVNTNYVPADNSYSADEPKRSAKLSSAAPEFSPLSANGHTPSFEQGTSAPVDAQGQGQGQVQRADGSNFVAVNVGQ